MGSEMLAEILTYPERCHFLHFHWNEKKITHKLISRTECVEETYLKKTKTDVVAMNVPKEKCYYVWKSFIWERGQLDKKEITKAALHCRKLDERENKQGKKCFCSTTLLAGKSNNFILASGFSEIKS